MRPRRETLGRKWIRKLKRFGKRAGILVVSLLAVGYGYMRFDFITKSDRLNLEIDKARANGLPVEPRDMERNPPVPDDGNAALSYQKCLPPPGEYERPTSWSLLPEMSLLVADDEVRATFRSYLELHRSELADIRRASKKPDCDFERNWDLGPNLLFPEFARLKSASKWLAAEAIVASLDGEWKLTLEDISAIGRLSRHVSQDGVLIAVFVGRSIESIGLRTAEMLASMSNVSDENLRKLKFVILAFPKPVSLQDSLKREAFMGYWMVRNISTFSDEWDKEAAERANDGGFSCGNDYIFSKCNFFLYPPLIEKELVERANAAECLRFWNKTFRQLRGGKIKLAQVGAEMDQYSNAMCEGARPWMPLMSIMMPTFGQLGVSQLRSESNRETVVALLDVLAFRTKKGSLPNDLSEVGQYIDPFGGAELKLQRSARGFRIYSIGADGIDGAGKLSSEMKDGERRSDDIIACFPSSDGIRSSSDESSKVNYLKSVARYEGKQTSAKEPSPAPSGQ